MFELHEARHEVVITGHLLARAKRTYRADPTPAKDRKMEKARRLFNQARRTWVKLIILKNAGV